MGLLTFLGVLVGAAGVYWRVSQRPRIVFRVSQAVPLVEGREDEQYVQVIDVENVGKKAARRIQVQFSQKVAKHELVRAHPLDQCEIRTGEKGPALVYEELGPGAVFAIKICTGTENLSAGDVTITHADGQGRVPGRWGWGFATAMVVMWALVGVYIIVIAFGIRSQRISHLGGRCYYAPRDVVLGGRPFYVGGEDWRRIHKTAVDRLFEEVEWSGDLSDVSSYAMLNQEAAADLSSAEWQSLLALANEALPRQMRALAEGDFRRGRARSILGYPKPVMATDEAWRAGLEAVGRLLFEECIEETVWRPGRALEVLREGPPKGLPVKLWEELRDELRTRYAQSLVIDMMRRSTADSYLEGSELSVLDDQLQTHVKSIAYGLARSRLPDLTRKSAAREFVETGRPSWMTVSDFERWRDLASSVVRMEEASEELARRDAQLSEREHQLEGMIKTVKQKLDFIDALLEDPAEIDRVEEYDATFAPGNWANLRLVADLLRTDRKQE